MKAPSPSQFYKLLISTVQGKSKQIIKDELNKLKEAFYISRTGIEMLDIRTKNPLKNGKGLPRFFLNVYDKNRRTPEEFEILDQKLQDARNSSRNMAEYRSKAEKHHYANCTTLACFLCDALISRKIDSRVFSLGGAHHFVIAKSEIPNKLIVIDPWAGIHFDVSFKYPIENLEKMSIDDRLRIAEHHFKATNLYPDYKESLDATLHQDPSMSKHMKRQISRQFFDITTTASHVDFNTSVKKSTDNKKELSKEMENNKTKKEFIQISNHYKSEINEHRNKDKFTEQLTNFLTNVGY